MRSEKQLWKLRRQNTWSPSSFKIRHKYQVQDLSVVCGKNEIWKPITKAESKKSSLSFKISYTNISFKIFLQRKILYLEISVWCKTFPKVLRWKWIFLVKLMTSSRNWQNSVFRSTTLSQYIAILFAADLHHHKKGSFTLYTFSTYVLLIIIIILCLLLLTIIIKITCLESLQEAVGAPPLVALARKATIQFSLLGAQDD